MPWLNPDVESGVLSNLFKLPFWICCRNSVHSSGGAKLKGNTGGEAALRAGMPQSITFPGLLQPCPVGVHLQGRVTGNSLELCQGKLN